MRIRKTLLQGSNLNANSVLTKIHQTITLKTPAADLPCEMAALDIEGIHLTKILAADHLARGLHLTTMDPRIGAGRAISITSSGLRLDLVAVVEIKVRAPTLTTRRSLQTVRRQQLARPRHGHPTMRTISDLRTGTHKEQASGLNRHRRMTLRHLCRLQPVMYRPPQTKARNSVLL